MSKIISIGTAVPKFGIKQGRILDYMKTAYKDEKASRILKILFEYSGIDNRYSVIPDFNSGQADQELFIEDQNIPTVTDRSQVFKEHAVSLAIDAINDTFKKRNIDIADFGITHLITVTCTGIYTPGIDASLIEKLNLPEDIFHTSINFLGCNAAFPALKLADALTRTDDKARVLIVCVELCTLHFQPKINYDNFLSNTIFGDGAAAVIITGDDPDFQGGMSMNGFYSLLLNKGKELMSWNITPVNYEMVLNARIPEFIGDEVYSIVMKAGNKFNIAPSAIDKWAIHPGGKKILDTIKKELNLKATDLQYSYKILMEYGNMSSPTILFVLNEIMKAEHNPNETILAMGFGPGLSIETALFTHDE